MEKTYISEVSEGLKFFRGEMSSEAFKGVLVDVFGVALKEVQGIAEDTGANVILELDNVLVGNDPGTTGRRQERSGFIALLKGRGSQDSREKSVEKR